MVYNSIMNHGRGVRVELNCELCAAPFIALASYARRGKARFCSKRCAGKNSASQRPAAQYKIIDICGYVRVHCPGHPKQDDSGYVKEHTLIAEAALGKPLVDPAVVHHFDLTKTNNANNNLVICQDATYHNILHARQRIKAAGGNPNTQLICHDCGTVKEDDCFCMERNGGIYRRGRSGRCRVCASKLQTRYRDQREAYRQRKILEAKAAVA